MIALGLQVKAQCFQALFILNTVGAAYYDQFGKVRNFSI